MPAGDRGGGGGGLSSGHGRGSTSLDELSPALQNVLKVLVACTHTGVSSVILVSSGDGVGVENPKAAKAWGWGCWGCGWGWWEP